MKIARHDLSSFATLTAFSLSLASLGAQPAPQFPVPDRLDLVGAVPFALENNFAIRQAKERIRQQDGVLVEVSARKIPAVNADAAYQQNDTTIASTFPAADRAWAISLTASQVIYAGGGVRASVKSSQLIREAAVLDLQATINEALFQVRTSFYAVLLATEKIVVQEKNLQLLEEQLKTTTDRYNAGTVSSFEELRAKVAVANARAPLITARNDRRLAIESVRQALGFTTNTRESLIKLPEFLDKLDYVPVTFDLQASFDAAHANRPDLLRLAKLTAAREEAVTAARANYHPSVSAFGGWQLRKGVTNDFGNSKDGWLIGVQSQWNIFDGRATAGRVAQARSALEQTRLTLAEAQLASEVEVRRAFYSWEQAKELVDASQQVVVQAEEAVRLAGARNSAGTGTQLDMLQASVDLLTARTNRIQSFYNYNVAVAALRKATGQPDELLAK